MGSGIDCRKMIGQLQTGCKQRSLDHRLTLLLMSLVHSVIRISTVLGIRIMLYVHILYFIQNTNNLQFPISQDYFINRIKPLLVRHLCLNLDITNIQYIPLLPYIGYVPLHWGKHMSLRLPLSHYPCLSYPFYHP